MLKQQDKYEPGLSAAERLYRDATDRLEKNFFNSMTENKGGQSQMISQTSKWITEQSNMFNGNLKDFHARQ